MSTSRHVGSIVLQDHYNLTNYFSGSNFVRSGRRCEGNQKPGDVRLLLNPFERDESPMSRDQFTAVNHSPITEKDSGKSAYLRGEIAESRSMNRLGNPPASSTASSNQHLLPVHAVSPPSHPMFQNWKIPSIYELLQGNPAGNELPPITN